MRKHLGLGSVIGLGLFWLLGWQGTTAGPRPDVAQQPG
jgi:hypothetical protein